MTSEKVLLGRLKDGELVFLTKHRWDCNWYWSMGYVGNSSSHYHFSSFLQDNKYASELFMETKITDADWWIIRDFFKQAYALKAAAEVYQYGGHQSSITGITDVIKNKEKAAILNADLEVVLNNVWWYTTQASQGNTGEILKSIKDH
jgi:hypothetical protein